MCLVLPLVVAVGAAIPFVVTAVLGRALLAYATMVAEEAGDPNAPCPAINFQTAQVYNTGNPMIQLIANRLADGSFVLNSYFPNLATKAVAMLGSHGNFQAGFVNCAGVGNRTRKPLQPNTKANVLGSSSRNPVITDLGGRRRGAGNRNLRRFRGTEPGGAIRQFRSIPQADLYEIPPADRRDFAGGSRFQWGR